MREQAGRVEGEAPEQGKSVWTVVCEWREGPEQSDSTDKVTALGKVPMAPHAGLLADLQY